MKVENLLKVITEKTYSYGEMERNKGIYITQPPDDKCFYFISNGLMGFPVIQVNLSTGHFLVPDNSWKSSKFTKVPEGTECFKVIA